MWGKFGTFASDSRKVTREQAIELVKEWKNAVLTLDKLIYDDAGKEFALTSMQSAAAHSSRTPS